MLKIMVRYNLSLPSAVSVTCHLSDVSQSGSWLVKDGEGVALELQQRGVVSTCRYCSAYARPARRSVLTEALWTAVELSLIQSSVVKNRQS